MIKKRDKNSQNPELVLQAALEELDIFTQSEIQGLRVSEEGRLVAAEKESPLKRIVELARNYIGRLLSDELRQEEEQKLVKLKHAVLHARDTILSHFSLIEKFKNGDPSQRKLAEYALSAIQRYNAVVMQGNPEITNTYNYERHCLLLDKEIKGREIELPHTVSIKYESHPDAHPAQKMLKELSQTLIIGAAKKTSSAISSTTYKKTKQFMIDTFHMKAIRMIELHLSHNNSIAEFLPLVKQTPVDIDEESDPNFIAMQQLLKVGPGFVILVCGCFKRNLSDAKFLAMPILDSFRLSFQLNHAGFPYPSQHTGWALSDSWIEAFPLRVDQVPLFQQVDQRRKRLTQQLLFDPTTIQKARRMAKVKKEVFDKHRDLFLPLHRQLQLSLVQNIFKEEEKDHSILDQFYREVAAADSPFDILVQAQQQIMDRYVKQPINALEEEWLGTLPTVLRVGSPQEKFQAASERFEQLRSKAAEQLDPSNPIQGYILKQGMLLGNIFHTIGLQYQSEKMGFSPPLLNDVERKLQACAFQQLISFMDQFEMAENLDPDHIKTTLLAAWSKDLQILQSATVEDNDSLAVAIINELEVYFNSRFYAFNLRYAEKAI